MMVRGCLIAFICLVLGGGPVYAAAGGGRSSQPIQIKSTELSTDSAKRTATFIGKVTARQGDVSIYCERLVIHYAEKEKDVDRVEAFGNVRIIQGNAVGQAGHAIYENNAGKIILEENPSVSQGKNIVAGKVITYYLDTQRSVVTSGGPDDRVKAIIYPKEKGADDGAKR